MALTQQDKQDIRQIFNEGITELVLPKFDDVDKRFDIIEDDVKELKKDVSILKEDVSILKEDVSILKEDVSILKKDVSILKEDVSDLQLTTGRIEMLQRAEIKRADDHSLQIKKLNQALVK